MRSFFREYLSFSKSQQTGIIILLVLIVMAFVAPSVYVFYKKHKYQPDLSFVESFEANPSPRIAKNVTVSDDSLFVFDPNTASLNEFQKLGLPDKLARTIIKYRQAGGVFRQPADLIKIYSFPDSIYQRLLPYIQIAEAKEQKTIDAVERNPSFDNIKKTEFHSTQSNQEIYELNTVDSTQLVSLPMIGPVIAKRIISYRQFLGGFYSVDQLKQVYNFPIETYNLVCNRFTVDSTLIVKINLNQTEFKQLNKHPYLSYTQIKALLSYRKSMGRFKSIDELVTYKLIDTITFQKLRPYLTIE